MMVCTNICMVPYKDDVLQNYFHDIFQMYCMMFSKIIFMASYRYCMSSVKLFSCDLTDTV